MGHLATMPISAFHLPVYLILEFKRENQSYKLWFFVII
jgi:hypothetical protein